MLIRDATGDDLPTDSGDFQTLREAGYRPGIGKAVGLGFAVTRDFLARLLIRVGATPNHLSFAGFIFTLGAAGCFLVGGSHALIGPAGGGVPTSGWPIGAAVFLFLASAGDMLDGAVARVGKIKSPFGAMLDSTLDRFSDVAMLMGLALHFALIENMTYCTLAMLAMAGSFSISYVKARAENLIDDCTVGYWMRGERSAGLLIASMSGHMPAYLWLLGIGPFFTVFRRVDYARRTIHAEANGTPAPIKGPFQDWRRHLAPWRFPRGSKHYDLVVGLCIAFILFAPLIWPFFYGNQDPLGDFLANLGLPDHP